MPSEVLREVNLRIYEAAHEYELDDAEFICECGRADCGVARLAMHLTDFADCLAAEGCAIVAPGHQPARTEIVTHSNAPPRESDGKLPPHVSASGSWISTRSPVL
jgi:hypothetical protein